jgi:uncharacterized membrane protein YgaE (UPF0421/DUF939 family)
MENFWQKSAIVWHMAVGSTVAWELARWAGSRHPFLAPLSVILCVKSSADKSIQFGWQRIGGTFFGVLLAAAAARYLSPNAWTLGLLLLAGGAILKGLKVTDTVIREAGLSILLVLAIGHQPHYALDRLRDTVIGVGTAMALMQLVARVQVGQR